MIRTRLGFAITTRVTCGATTAATEDALPVASTTTISFAPAEQSTSGAAEVGTDEVLVDAGRALDEVATAVSGRSLPVDTARLSVCAEEH
jgi:hypothetical protein